MDVGPLGRGLDHVAVLVGGDTVLRVALDPDAPARAEAIRREAGLLGAVAVVAPVAVPLPTAVAPEDGWIAHPLLPGRLLLEADPALRARLAPAVGAVLGRLMAEVAALPPPPGVHLDDTPSCRLLEEARAFHLRVEGAIPPGHRDAVRAFLAEAPPGDAPRDALVLCHDDLGIEHVLVDGDGAVTGVIDWSDAAVTDPAGDLGRIHRDLGPAALDAALAAFGAADPAVTRLRAVFRARCGAIEDLAYGLDEDRPAHVAKVVAALPWLFPPLSRPASTPR
ncbi:MAG TPA: aminoglycoside phosphotransferase family protein [Miltoncostaea sp.]|nr:aminoglycoside phosphotransferase family protein [Miltoncostaea sp.]